jgi:hypothetical protein
MWTVSGPVIRPDLDVGGFCWAGPMSIQQLRPPAVTGAVAGAQARVREEAARSAGPVCTIELGEAIAGTGAHPRRRVGNASASSRPRPVPALIPQRRVR